jgi:hypothetical protein
LSAGSLLERLLYVALLLEFLDRRVQIAWPGDGRFSQMVRVGFRHHAVEQAIRGHELENAPSSAVSSLSLRVVTCRFENKKAHDDNPFGSSK